MKCLVCGVEFHESDIEVMEDGEEPICDECAEDEQSKLH